MYILYFQNSHGPQVQNQKKPPPKTFMPRAVTYPYPPGTVPWSTVRGVNLACRDVDGPELSKAPFSTQKKMEGGNLGMES